MEYPKKTGTVTNERVPKDPRLIKIKQEPGTEAGSYAHNMNYLKSIVTVTNEQVYKEPGLIKVKQEPGAEGTGQTNLIINYLPPDMTDDELFNMFVQIGEVVKFKIVRDKRSGKSLGYGFVELGNGHMATRAKKLWNGRELRGKTLKVDFARPRSEEILNANLYVAYLPRDMNEDGLKAMFGHYGTIIQTKVLRSKITGQPRGAGFVRFDQHMAAQIALNALDNHIPNGALRPISVQFANGPLRVPKKEHCGCCSRQYALNFVRAKEDSNASPRPFSDVRAREDSNASPRPFKRYFDQMASPRPFKRYFEPVNQQGAKRVCGNTDPRLG